MTGGKNNMPKQIESWREMVGLESENYKLEVTLMPHGGGCAWIRPKVETRENRGSKHNVYLSTHTFYESHYLSATRTLQKFGFDVELVKDG